VSKSEEISVSVVTASPTARSTAFACVVTVGLAAGLALAVSLLFSGFRGKGLVLFLAGTLAGLVGVAITRRTGRDHAGRVLAANTLATVGTATAEPVDGPPRSVHVCHVIVPKPGASESECEDAIAVGADVGRVAVADGASSAFESRKWAEALTSSFVERPPAPLDIDSASGWLTAAAERWSDSLDDPGEVGEPPSWWSEDAMTRGAFATFVGLEIGLVHDGTPSWRAVAVGDSCLFHVQRHDGAVEISSSFPIDPGSTLGRHPYLLHSGDPETQVGRLRWASGRAQAGDVLVLCTDAVAAWLLDDGARIREVVETDADGMRRLLAQEMEDGRMRRDDAAIAVLTL
jgi:hypothetical protein